MRLRRRPCFVLLRGRRIWLALTIDLQGEPMRTIIAAFLAAGLLVACGGAQKTPPRDPRTELQRLIALYEENRAKFVVQKEKLSSGEDCGRATRLRKEIDALAEEAAMSPDNTDTITLVQMELQQAEKDCLAK